MNIAVLIDALIHLSRNIRARAHNLMNIAAFIAFTDTLKLKYQSMNTQPDEHSRAYCNH